MPRGTGNNFRQEAVVKLDVDCDLINLKPQLSHTPLPHTPLSHTPLRAQRKIPGTLSSPQGGGGGGGRFIQG